MECSSIQSISSSHQAQPVFSGTHIEKPWSWHFSCVQGDRSCSPVKFVLDLKINGGLSAPMLLGTRRARFISLWSWQSPWCPLGKSSLRAHTHLEWTLLFLLLFAWCPEIQELSSAFQVFRYLVIPFPTKSFKAFFIEVLSLQGPGRILTWLFSWSSDYAPHLLIWVHLVFLTDRWALESGLVSTIDQIVIVNK